MSKLSEMKVGQVIVTAAKVNPAAERHKTYIAELEKELEGLDAETNKEQYDDIQEALETERAALKEVSSMPEHWVSDGKPEKEDPKDVDNHNKVKFINSLDDKGQKEYDALHDEDYQDSATKHKDGKSWFDKLSDGKKKAYIETHPDSKYAK